MQKSTPVFAGRMSVDRPTSAPSFSVVVPAHDESAVIARCLAFTADLADGEADVVVAANGCTDETAQVARGVAGVRVVELPAAGKTGALNAADEVAAAFPRIYLDADVAVDAGTLRRLCGALDGEQPRVAAPVPHFVVTGRPLSVRLFYAVYRRLPYVRDGLVGLGMYAVNAAGHARIGRFPAVTADDLFVQRRFRGDELRVVEDAAFRIETPYTLRSLIRVRARTARGNAELSADGSGAHARSTAGTLRGLGRAVARRPWLVPAAAVYLAVTVAGRFLARRPGGPAWYRDDSTRSAVVPGARRSGEARVRVAYLVSEYPLLSHTFIQREIAALRRAGASVTSFSIRPPTEATLASAENRAEAARTQVLLGPSRRPLVRAHLRLLRRRPDAWAAAARLALRTGPRRLRARLWQFFYFAEAVLLHEAMRRDGLRHVHVHLANNGADVARLAVALGNHIDRGTADGTWSWSMAMHGPTEFADVTHYDLAAKVRSARFVACISDYCRSQLMALVEASHWPALHIVRMGVDLRRFVPMGDERRERDRDGRPLRVLFVGRLVEQKAPQVLLEAVRILHERAVPVEVVLAGAGPLRDELTRQAAAAGVDARLPGPVTQEEIAGYYRWADVFCLPSFAEGLPVVLMEAMATELPVVTTTIAGIPELVLDGTCGSLVPPGRADELATALQRLAADPDLRDSCGRSARARVVARHDAATVVTPLYQLFAELLPTSSATARTPGDNHDSLVR